MPRVDPRTGRVTEIRCHETKGYGSGYLLAPDLVLTAAHVVADRTTGLPAKLRIEARTVEDHLEDGNWRRAKLAWPSSDTWIEKGRGGPDIALLEITPDDRTSKLGTPLGLGWGDLSTSANQAAEGTGFPAFTYDDTENKRDTHQLACAVNPGSLAASGRFSLTNIGREPPGGAKEWKGLSGAALFLGSRLVGVITLRSGKADDIQDFLAARLDRALEDPAFRARVAQVSPTGMAGQSGGRASVGIDRLVCRLDREAQVREFEPGFRVKLTASTFRPLCCLIVGNREHDPPECAARLRYEAGRLAGRADADLALFHLPWERKADDVATAIKGLRRELWRLVDRTGQAVPTIDDEFRRAVNARDGEPLLMHSELPSTLDGPQATLMSEWLGLWHQLAGHGLETPVAHVVLLPNKSEADAKAWLGGVTSRASVDTVVLPELEPCFWTDLTTWLERWVMREARLPGPRKLQLETALEGKLGGGDFTIRSLKSALSELMHPGSVFEDLAYG